jgi:hypothetical protein
VSVEQRLCFCEGFAQFGGCKQMLPSFKPEKGSEAKRKVQGKETEEQSRSLQRSRTSKEDNAQIVALKNE